MVSLLETIAQLSGVLLLLCAIYYYFHFKKTKRERKLTPMEMTVYLATQAGFFLLAGSYLLLLLDKS